MSMIEPLDKELQYFIDNQEALVRQYNGQVLVIKEEQVIVYMKIC